jgi:hypothetical protein
MVIKAHQGCFGHTYPMFLQEKHYQDTLSMDGENLVHLGKFTYQGEKPQSPSSPIKSSSLLSCDVSTQKHSFCGLYDF